MRRPQLLVASLGTSLAILTAAAPAAAVEGAERTVCGVRSGTAGNAYIDPPRGPSLELARQGGSQRLLDQADALVGPDGHGESGTQNGTRYCVRVRVDGHGTPVRVLTARRAR